MLAGSSIPARNRHLACNASDGQNVIVCFRTVKYERAGWGNKIFDQFELKLAALHRIGDMMGEGLEYPQYKT